MLRNKKVLMLISLLVAIGLWMYVMGNVDPVIKERVSGVRVEMEGQHSLNEADLTATLNSPKEITVTIEGKRSQVNKTKKVGMKAFVDVSTCDYGKNEKDIYVKLPDSVAGVTIEDLSEDTAIFTVK
ncbi:MAG: CdaR family protein [Clostridia bacterium]|nr:CdaR family protein [Clostridia bacterium]